MDSKKDTIAKSLQKVLKKRVKKLKEEALVKPLSAVSAVQPPIIPTIKKDNVFNINIRPSFTGEASKHRYIDFDFTAFVSKNEENAMFELINEIENNFENFKGSTQVNLDRTEKLYKLISSKINEYSKDFVKGLKELFEGINSYKVVYAEILPQYTSETIVDGKKTLVKTGEKTERRDFDGIEVVIDGRGKEVNDIKSLYELMESLANNRLNRIELEEQPLIMESITEKQPTVIQPSFVPTKPTYTPPKAPVAPVAKAPVAPPKASVAPVAPVAKAPVAPPKSPVIGPKKQGQGLKKTSHNVLEDGHFMPLKGHYMTEDIFGQASPNVVKMLGKGVKPMKPIKKPVKANDARRVRGAKIRELMKNEGISLAEASKKLKMMKL
jgi:hypothetical protein